MNGPGPIQPIGFEFHTLLGPRRSLVAGECGYFQREQRRYLCEVLEAKREPIRERFRAGAYRRDRLRLRVRVIA